MAKFKNNTLDQLVSQLRFAPVEQKEKELKGVRSLLTIIGSDKQYPVEFICFKITGYRPREDMTGVFVDGKELAIDLAAFIIYLSRQLSLDANKQGQPVYSTDQLAKKFSVSTKTISRWRTRGLIAMTFVFADGAKRIGFLKSDLDDFAAEDPAMLARAGKFTQLTLDEKQQIIARAQELAEGQYASRSAVLRQIMQETSRSQETIRYTLIDHEKKTSSQIFKKPSGMITPRDASMIYNLKKQGMSIPELMQMFSRSRSSIHRIINTRRAKTLHGRKIEFIDSPDFLQDDADQAILTQSDELTEFLKHASKGFKRLSKHLEVELFRRYNYLKYLACLRQRQIDLHRPSGKRLDEIASCLDRAEATKNIIVEANLGLVVSIAKKHLTTGASMPDLVSEGNFSLMRAIDGFDYCRGYRFSTYGTLAISKDFARLVPQEAARLDRPGQADLADFQQDMRIMQSVDVDDIERAQRSLDLVIKENLTDREQYIIRNHFGMEGDRITNKAKTLKQIGETLNLSKERVRQIELIALQQLRHCLSPEEFDLLTK